MFEVKRMTRIMGIWLGFLWVLVASYQLSATTGESIQMVSPVQALSCQWPSSDYDDFYLPPSIGAFSSSRLGELLRIEHIRSYSATEVADIVGVSQSTVGVEAYRIMYLSQAPIGTPQPVTGVILVPLGQDLETRFPLLISGHPTTGAADQCAPSKRLLDVQSLIPWAAAGYMVVSTDYVGLGTPGPHPYGIGEAAAYSMLDSARAALNFCDTDRGLDFPAENRAVLEGYSQGGHAALFAHQAQETYAPELNVVATALFAPGSELRSLAQFTAGQEWSLRVSPLALAMHAYVDYYDTEVPLSDWLQEPFASELPDQAESLCIAGLSAWTGFRPSNVFQSSFLDAVRNGDWDMLEPWSTYTVLNSPGEFTSDIPILILQGERDELIPVETNQQLTERLCRNRNPVRLDRYVGVGHTNIVSRARPDALAWLSDRLNGVPWDSACTSQDVPVSRREMEPVVISGAQLSAFTGILIDQIKVYAYTENSWEPISFQIDERDLDGTYVSREDGLFDENDELVLMAKDAADRAEIVAWLTSSAPSSELAMQIAIHDPLDANTLDYVYVVWDQADLGRKSDHDYVAFDPLSRRITGRDYTIGFPLFLPVFDHLRLGNGVDILDRTKIHLACEIPLTCPITEESLITVPNYEIVKDGLVRVIGRQGAVMGYENLITWSESYSLTAGIEGAVTLSTDFAPAAVGSTIYNAAVPFGVTIDGIQDQIPAVPLSNWWQTSTDTGTVIQVINTAFPGSVVTNYYNDQAVAVDETDTGDQKHYGETGIVISEAQSEMKYEYVFYFLTGRQPNIGSELAFQYENPLVAITERVEIGADALHHAYLPQVQR